ncbi:hypothetical protein HHI36_017134 [Cryptolaemus montrouzieri]|uniref:Ionotropic receptor n=1 Tax=Cryptolaemus montrouzieri TaxID=559131 RepID=A0ABD2NM41_9CUCU
MSMISCTFLVTLTLHVVFCNEITPPKVENYKANYFLNLMKYYDDFSKIFHIDKKTEQTLRDRLKGTDETFLNTIMIYNHDYYNPNMKRYEGGAVLHVILLKNLKQMEGFLSDYSNISKNDVLIIITFNEKYGLKLPKKMRIKHRHAAGNLLILNLTPDNIQMYHICHYCGIYENNMFLLQSTNGSKVDIESKMLLANQFNQFFGHKFTILFNQYFPYMHCLKYKPTQHANETYNICLEWEGIEANMLKELSEVMNFTYKLLALTEYITVPKMLPYIHMDKQIHIAIGGIGLSALRIKKLSFTRSINFENFVLMYKIHIGLQDRLFAFLEAFSMTIWFSLAFTLFVQYMALFVFIQILYKREKWLRFFKALPVKYILNIKSKISITL